MNDWSMDAILTVAFWSLFGTALTATLADKFKGRPFDGGLIGFLMGPIFGPMCLVFFADARPRCPHCRETVHPKATACRSCGRSIGNIRAKPETFVGSDSDEQPVIPTRVSLDRRRIVDAPIIPRPPADGTLGSKAADDAFNDVFGSPSDKPPRQQP